MTVQYTADGISYRLVVVIAFDQDGKQTGYATLIGSPRAGALQQAGQFRKNGRRIPSRRRRLTCGKADFALRHSDVGAHSPCRANGTTFATSFLARIAANVPAQVSRATRFSGS